MQRAKKTVATVGLFLLCSTPAWAQAEQVSGDQAAELNSNSTKLQGHAFVFRGPDGTRTIDTQGSRIIPNLLPSDQVHVEGNVINIVNGQGRLVGSVKADLPEGLKLKLIDGFVIATDADGISARCIGNKWVGLGLNVVGDALVCVPFGAATGGAGGFACGAAVGAGITAASC